MNPRQVIRDPSHHITYTTEYLHLVAAKDEADRETGNRVRRIHLLLNMPPRLWAAFFFIKHRKKAAMKIGLRTSLVVLIAMLTVGCASGPPKLPYPAFIQVDELDDIFMASLPGVRAKQLSGDPQTRRTSNRIDLPRDWKGTSGGVPGRSMELFVIRGEMLIADIVLEQR